MFVSKKCQYALRAVFELAKNTRNKPLKIAEIAKAQAIPRRFLEVILNQLKKAGFVESQRGNEGGYMLTRLPYELTVGDVVRFVQGPIGPVGCVADQVKDDNCPLYGDCVFMPMWEKVQRAISEIYDSTTFQDLVDMEGQMSEKNMYSYSI